MFDVVSESTDIAPACGPAPGAPSSRTAAAKVDVGSPLNEGAWELSLAMARVIRQDPPSKASYVALASSRFGAVYRRGRRSERGGVMVIQGSGESGPPQVGIVAGRGVGNAVLRNRAKRRLREAIRQVELRPDTAYVVVASTSTVAVPFDALIEALGQAIVETEESGR